MGAPGDKNIRASNTVLNTPSSKATPPAGAGLLPGADWLGYGYRPFGPIIDSDWASRENLFELPESTTEFSFFGKQYNKPALVTALLSENEAKCKVVNQNSVRTTISEIYDKLMGGASKGLFKGEFELSYSSSLEKHWEYRAAAVQLILRMLRLALPTDMRRYVRPEVALDLENAGEDAEATAAHRAAPHDTNFTALFERWGTHYISGLHVGGSYNLYMKFLSSSYKSANELNAKVSAAYGCLSGSNQTKISEGMQALDERQELFITAYGGLDAPTDWSQLAFWKDAVRENPGPISFYGDQMQGLTPIYTLVSEPARREALKQEWKAFCSTHALVVPKLGKVVTAIRVATDKDAARARQKVQQGGFELLDVDLNAGAGGYYVYVGKKFVDAETEEVRPLLNLVAIEGDSPGITAPRRYEKHPTDLNCGAKGTYIFLCSTSEAGGDELLTPIRDITAEYSRGALNLEHFKKAGWIPVSRPGEQEPLDLNRHTPKHEFYVYLEFCR